MENKNKNPHGITIADGEIYYNSINDLINNFIYICNKIKDNNNNLAFAFIFDSIEKPFIEHIIKDPIYRRSLDYITGQDLVVYFFLRRNKFKKIESANYKEELYSTLLPLINESDINPEDENNILTEIFGLKKKLIQPVILYFQVLNSSVLGPTILTLNEKNVSENFIELRNGLKEVMKVLSLIEERENSQEIYYNIEREIKSSKYWNRASRFIRSDIFNGGMRVYSIGNIIYEIINLLR